MSASSKTVSELENQVKDKMGFFSGFRVCHIGNDICCGGFWKRHKNFFQAGQVALRLGLVEFVDQRPESKEK